MRILIIATNKLTYPYAVPPLGAAIMTSTFRRAGHRAELLDLCFTKNPESAVRHELKRFLPDVVGLSIRNLDSCSYHYPESYVEPTRRIVRAIREETGVPIIAGGSAVTIGGLEFLENLEIDFGIVGEGEVDGVALVESLAKARSGLESISRLIAREKATSHKQPPRAFCQLDEQSLNDVSPVRIAPYLRLGGLVGLQTKRGCPFSCIYCNYPVIEGRRYRLRSPELCVDDMERVIIEQGTRDFFFADSVFNLPREHTLELCAAILRRGLRIRWMAYCNPLHLDREMAKAFKNSGCMGIELGLDAATDKMLEILRKQFTTQDIERASTALRTEGIPFAHFLLFGGPSETWDDIDEARRVLEDMPLANAVFASLGIRVYPETQMYDVAQSEGLIDDGAPVIEPVYYLSPELGSSPKAELDRIAAKTTTWLTPTDWESPLIKTMHTLSGRLRAFPSWKRFREYGKRMRRRRCRAG